MYKIGNTTVSFNQLLKLGASLKEKNITKTIYSTTLTSGTDLTQLSLDKKISIRPDYWFYCLLEIYDSSNSREQIDWLLVTAQFIDFDNNKDFEYSIKKIKEVYRKKLHKPFIWSKMPFYVAAEQLRRDERTNTIQMVTIHFNLFI